MQRPKRSEYEPYYQRYVDHVPETEIVPVLDAQPAELRVMFDGVSEGRGTYTYADGKWTIKEVLSHLIDSERMFMYRALRVSRGDKTPIEGFEQEGYIENSNANGRTFADLLEEFSLLRKANVMFFKNFDDIAWTRIGTANDAQISSRALAYIMAGHIRHHEIALRERYLA
jgi:hypothetical protein